MDQPETRRKITTKAWQRAGFPFEGWLRYAASDEQTQRKVEVVFWEKHPDPKED